MNKHTPGPWEYRPALNYNGYSISPLGILPTLAACERFNNSMAIECFNFPGSTEANARLIAAAPELLEALEAVDVWFSSPSPRSEEHLDWLAFCDNQLKLVRAAIAKAKGEY